MRVLTLALVTVVAYMLQRSLSFHRAVNACSRPRAPHSGKFVCLMFTCDTAAAAAPAAPAAAAAAAAAFAAAAAATDAS